MKPKRVPEGLKNGVKSSTKKDAKKGEKKSEFSDPGGAPPKHPGSFPNAGNLHEKEDHPKEREQEKQEDIRRHGTTPRALRPGADFVTFWGVLGSHFGSQSGIKMASKIDKKR